MAIDHDGMLKPVRKFRKLLKKMPSQPNPDEVHDLRTNARKLEATFQAVSLDSAPPGKKILKNVSKLRKRAGKVRDMDVLTGHVSGIPRSDGERECLVRLLEHLGARRKKYAKKLNRARRQHAAQLRKQLKQTSKALEEAACADKKKKADNCTATANVAASALQLVVQLGKPAHLSKGNLHPYRLKVKELRSLLLMAEDGNRQEFVERLGKVKDAIGEWHDWQELILIAKDVLDHKSNCHLVEAMRRIEDSKFHTALELTQAVRKKFLRVPDRGNRRSSKHRRSIPAEPVWEATAALAA